MRRWQFDVLFVVAVAGAIAMLFVPDVPPAAVTGITAIIAFVLAQRPDWTKDADAKHKSDDDG